MKRVYYRGITKSYYQIILPRLCKRGVLSYASWAMADDYGGAF